jgi:hypothetical protein
MNPHGRDNDFQQQVSTAGRAMIGDCDCYVSPAISLGDYKNLMEIILWFLSTLDVCIGQRSGGCTYLSLNILLAILNVALKKYADGLI